MKRDSYIVEGTNWKCKVDLEKNPNQDKEYNLIEAATRCVEHLFGNYTHPDTVDVFELKDTNGVDYFKQLDIDDVPDPAIGLLTKVYKLKDVKNSDNHYVIKTRDLLHNASALDSIILIEMLETQVKLKNPELYKFVCKTMKDKFIVKFGDLE